MKPRIVGIVPAAGKGTRLSPFPCPKELFPIGYQDYRVGAEVQRRPKVISQYLIENMIQAGAGRILTILGADKYDIMRYYGNGSRFGVDFAYLYQEELHGMPYAINLARSWVGDATVVFGMPDTVMEPADVFVRLLQRQREADAVVTLGLFPTEFPEKFGMVETDAHDRVLSTVDKPKATHLKFMWGCACWSARFTEFLDESLRANPFSGREVVLGDVFNLALREKLPLSAVRFPEGQYIDIGTAAELDAALKKFHL